MGMISDLWVKLGLKSDEFNKGIDGAQKKTESFGKSIGNIFSNLANSLGLGGIVSQFQTITNSVGAFFISLRAASGGAAIFSGAMRVIKAALISTGVGALVVALGTLVSYFTMTERGAEQLERGLAGLKAIFSVLIDRASMFGEGLVKIFSGNFSDGWDKMKNSVKGVGAEMSKEVATAVQLAKRLQDLEDRERDLTVSLEERRAKAALLRQQAKEEGFTAEEKMKKLQEATNLYKSIFKDEKSIEVERASILEAQIMLGEKRDDKLLELEKTKAKAVQKDTEQAQTLKGLSREMNAVNNELQENIKLQKQALEATSKPMVGKGFFKQKKEFTTTFNSETGKMETSQPGLLDIKTEELGLDESINKINEARAKLKGELGKVKYDMVQFTADLDNLIASGMANAIESFATGLADLAAGNITGKDFGKQVLGMVGSFMVQLGMLMITTSKLYTAWIASLSNPATAIAGIGIGIALVVAGAAVSALAKKGPGGGGYSSGGSYTQSSYQGTQGSAQQGMNGNVYFEIQGSKLVGVLANTATNKRIKG